MGMLFRRFRGRKKTSNHEIDTNLWWTRKLTKVALDCAVICAILCVVALHGGAMAQETGQTRATVLEAERLLSDLGYWTGEVDGVFDAGSRHALVASQKTEGRRLSSRLTAEELDALRQASRPIPREASGRHIEIDLTRQVFIVVDESGMIKHILPVSSGNEQTNTNNGSNSRAHTPRGRFQIERKITGWRRSTLGLLYYPNYITGGIAIHGSPSVPAHPASHGCIRIPMFASRAFSEMMPVGTPVLVYD